MDNSELQSRLAELHPESYGWALHCCRDDATQAEDVLQTAYLKVLDGRANFGEKSAFKTWLFGVVRNTAREEHRRQRLRRLGLLRVVSERQSSPSPERSALDSERRGHILRMMEKLSPRQREVLHLVFYQDLTIEDAAEIMGISLGSARKHYDRGKQRLRAHLESNPLD